MLPSHESKRNRPPARIALMTDSHQKPRIPAMWYIAGILLGILIAFLVPCCIWPTLVDVWRMTFGG